MWLPLCLWFDVCIWAGSFDVRFITIGLKKHSHIHSPFIASGGPSPLWAFVSISASSFPVFVHVCAQTSSRVHVFLPVGMCFLHLAEKNGIEFPQYSHCVVPHFDLHQLGCESSSFEWRWFPKTFRNGNLRKETLWRESLAGFLLLWLCDYPEPLPHERQGCSYVYRYTPQLPVASYLSFFFFPSSPFCSLHL